MRLNLPDVTAVMIDVQCHDLARLALFDSMRDIDFGEVIVFCDADLSVPGTRWVKVPRWPTIADCCKFLWYELPDHISTDWMVLLHWDGWIVDPTCWSEDFLQYDYIGAPWCLDDGFNVGNGNALRSLRLMRFLQQNPARFPLTTYKEDDLVSRVYRTDLERLGFKWAPETLASQFSFECSRPSWHSRHFMFHDSFNFPLVLSGERLNERVELMRQNPSIKHKLAELESGRRPMILPHLAAPRHSAAA
jgi:hypothetical protein